MRTGTLVAGSVVLGMCLAGCQHRVPAAVITRATPAPARTPEPPRPPAPPARARAAAAPAALSESDLFRRTSLDELNAEHPLGDVFFDYDNDGIRDEGRNALRQDAAWLAKWPQTRVVIEGHCDERGSAEYNLALGDRRADIVRNYLVTLGIPADRLVVKTLGKEAPFCTGDGESCWSQNRRGHFVITAK